MIDRAALVIVIGLAAACRSSGSSGAPGASASSTSPAGAVPGDDRATVASRLAEVGEAARARLRPHVAQAGLAYPPGELTLVAIKDAATVEVWARGDAGAWRFVRDYPVMAASGGGGPKLREGDLQVPEGIYRIDWLNPNSAYHLSMHVDYPNDFDRAHAAVDGRTALGGAIMIHGRDVSVGCLAMGDPAIEELFTLVADTGLWIDDDRARPRVKVVLAPTDLRARPDAPPPPDAPAWTGELYRLLVDELAAYAR